MAEIARGPVPLVVRGDSAVGNLPAVVPATHATPTAPSRRRVLIYPVTDSRPAAAS
jgi:hypothetical protein